MKKDARVVAIATGRELGQRSLDLAFAKAERDDPDFGDAAVRFFVAIAKGTYPRPVGVAEARLASAGHVPAPKNLRAWGQVPKLAEKLGCVRHAGFGASTDRRSHACPRSLWLYVKDVPFGRPNPSPEGELT